MAANKATNSTPMRAWVPRWLAVMRDTANVRLACQAAGVDRSTPYKLRQKSPSFAAAWKEAEEDACDLLESEARKRASESSDQLMMFLLKAHRPQKFRERFSIELVQRFEEMSDDELNEYIVRRLIESAPGGADSPGDAAVAAGEGAASE